MQTELRKLPDERIIIRTFGKDYSYARDRRHVLNEDVALLDAQPEPVFHVLDLRELDLSFDDLLTGTHSATKESRFFGHPKQFELVVVTTSAFLKLAAKGMSSPIFGSQKVRVFDTVEHALEYARAELQKHTP